jgi:hypothetical protein
MEKIADLEKYLNGVPQNEALQRMLDGEPEESDNQFPLADPDYSLDSTRPLSDTDRVNLQRMIQEPGWRVFLRMLEMSIGQREKSASIGSQNDPLANSDHIARLWAYVLIEKNVKKEMVLRVQQEIAALKGIRG